MSISKLALFGGSKVIDREFKRYNSIGQEEIDAVTKVVASGNLSQFLGCWDKDFFGGPMVKAFEADASQYFGVKHAICVNSWTSGLIAAIGAIGIEPGDEVIVSPWTMCASATAILHWNAIPVFADIDPNTYCLDPDSVEANITPYTKAIMSVDIFGQSANMARLGAIAKKYGLKIVSDTAQAPGALCEGKFAGTIADIGGYSLNYHKHIHTGEGGIIVTNDDNLADRLCLIRNHAEAVVGGKGTNNIANMIGYNFRLGEIEAAIGISQLKKLSGFVESRQKAALALTEQLKEFPGLKVPEVSSGNTHVYYLYPLQVDPISLGVSRNKFVKALQAEGVQGLSEGYTNIHLLPMYQNKIAFGSKGFPWNSDICKRDVTYEKGICPNAEYLHDTSHIGLEMCLHQLEESDVHSIGQAFKKVWDNINDLK